MRKTAVLTGALAGVLLLASPALAHVTVKSSEAKRGGYAKLAFRVPNEKDVATTKLEVAFPTKDRLKSVSVKPHAGWTYKTTKGTDDLVSSIVWTATAGGIKPGEFDEFEVSAGPLPAAEQLVFKALQTYADGEVVRWIEEAPAGSTAHLDHPAPVLKLAAADAPPATDHATARASAAPTINASPVASAESSKGLGLAGLAVAVVAALLAVAALLRGGRRHQG